MKNKKLLEKLKSIAAENRATHSSRCMLYVMFMVEDLINFIEKNKIEIPETKLFLSQILSDIRSHDTISRMTNEEIKAKKSAHIMGYLDV